MIVDSSALIPLSRVGRLDLLRRLYSPVRTTRDVRRECVDEGAGRPGLDALRKAFDEWIMVVEPPRWARRLAKAEGIEVADASLVAACEALGEDLLANDYHLLRVARARGVAGRWLTSVVLQAVHRKILSKGQGRDLLIQLEKEGLRVAPDVLAAVLEELQRDD